MSLETTLQQIYDLPVSGMIRENVNAFPLIESFHVLAITLVFGTILIVDLRLMGFAGHRGSARKLIAELLPYTWVAFAVAAVTGSLLFVSNAPAYANNTQFLLKLVAIAFAGLNMAVFHLSAHRQIAEWDASPIPPAAARIAGVVSAITWITVIFLGRWIGFTLDVLF